MFWTNYHSHCNYCDGTDEPEEYIKEAVNLRVKAYGFSSHAPISSVIPVKWTMPSDKIIQYSKEIDHLKQKYQDIIQIYKSLEADYIPGIASPTSTFIRGLKLDYVIGSVHFIDQFNNKTLWEIDGKTSLFKKGLKEIFDNNIKKVVKKYFKLTRDMVKKHTPDIIGHFDKIKMHNRKKSFFEETDKWYQEEVLKTLITVAKTGCILEVNTRGLYKGKTKEAYPSEWILSRAYELNIPVMINSDAHHPTEITSQFEETAAMLQRIGYQKIRVLLDGVWQDRNFTPKGIEE